MSATRSSSRLAAKPRVNYNQDTEERSSPQLRKYAIEPVGTDYPLIPKQTPEITLAIVLEDEKKLRYLRHQTPDSCLAAVSKDGLMLQHVRAQTPEICLAAVKQNPRAIRYAEKTYYTPELLSLAQFLACQEMRKTAFELKDLLPETLTKDLLPEIITKQ
jgi:hypothetical protein